MSGTGPATDERPATETDLQPAAPGDHDPGATGPKRGFRRWWWAVGIAIAVLVVVVLAPLASSDPDGLERVAEDAGFIHQAENVVSGLLGDYAIPGVDDPAMATVLSGLVGVAVLVVLMLVLGRVLARRRG